MDQAKTNNMILNGLKDYMISIKGQSLNTIKSYEFDLIQFFRFLLIRNGIVSVDTPFETIPIDQVNIPMLTAVKLPDIYAFLSYATIERQNSDATRKRKTAAIRKLYHYMKVVLQVEMMDPSENLELPKVKQRDPIYMTLDEALSLLNAVDGTHKKRDLAILTLFLNCGMRLSELTNLKLTDIQDETLHIVGKGNKERNIMLNDACAHTLQDWLDVRPKESDCPYVFVSKRRGEYHQIGTRAVQDMFNKTVIKAGLNPEKFSVHKMRHTAATLMHKYGGVDIRTLQKVLGHENISTTEIYTHIEDDQVRDALYKNPLGAYKTN